MRETVARRGRMVGLCVTLTSALLLTVPGLATAAPAESGGPQSFPVAFTGGVGVFLRSGPTDTEESKLQALPEGALVPVECETIGVPRTNVYGQTSDIYVRSPGGAYVASIFIDNGVLGRSDAPDCDLLDAVRTLRNTPRTVGDYLREGQSVVYSTDGPDRRRGYYSHAETDQAARDLSLAASQRDLLNNVGCTAIGVLVTVGTDGMALVVAAGVGAGIGFGCSALSQNDVESIASVARAASSTGKCLELRYHRSGDSWVLDEDGATMTDHIDYCG